MLMSNAWAAGTAPDCRAVKAAEFALKVKDPAGMGGGGLPPPPPPPPPPQPDSIVMASMRCDNARRIGCALRLSGIRDESTSMFEFSLLVYALRVDHSNRPYDRATQFT